MITKHINTIPKLLISVVLIAFISSAYFTETAAPTLNLSSDSNEEVGMIGENEVDNTEETFGKLDLKEQGKHDGYGYIGDKKDKEEGFGAIDVPDAIVSGKDTARIASYFPSKVIKYKEIGDLPYAIIEDEAIYLENINLSYVSGFNGPIELGLLVNLEGFIDSLIYINSEETPSYLDLIIRKGYFDLFKHLPLDKNHQLDAISGATISSVAIARSVDELYQLSYHAVLKDYLSRKAAQFTIEARLNKMWVVNTSLLVISFLLVLFKRFRKKRNLLLLSVFLVIWLGFYLNASFTYLLFQKLNHLSRLSVFTIVYLLLILLTTVWFKNPYCKYICPFGNVQKLMFKYSPFKGKSLSLKNKHLKILRYVVSAFVIVGYFSGIRVFAQYEPFPHLFSFYISDILFWISLIIIILSAFIPNIWCRALCPTGCVLDSLSSVSNKKIRQ